MHTDGEENFRSRRTHRKSRSGCANCKRRRIKCDEERPSCINCTNHNIECSFAGNDAAAGLLPPSIFSEPTPVARPRLRRYKPFQYPTGGVRQTFKLTKPKDQPKQRTCTAEPQYMVSQDSSLNTISLADLQLFHHYTISTYKTMREDHQDLVGIWQKYLPEWGIEFPSILHLILALSALHLGHGKPELREQYIRQADHHFTFGVRSVTAILSQLNSENCQKVYMAAVMICLIYFGRGPRPGDYLIFSDHGPAEWVVLMNGVKLILQSYQEKIFSGILEPNGERILCGFTSAMRTELHEHRVHLEAVQRFLEEENADKNECEIELSAVHDLIGHLHEIYEKASAGKSGVFLMDVLIGWIYRQPEEFVHLLQQKNPRALVIFAHWAVLLLYMEKSWFMEGWAKHVLTGISGSLAMHYQSWIQWPLQKVNQA